MQIQISWLLQKPTDLDLHCLQRQDIFGFSRTRVKSLEISGCVIEVLEYKSTEIVLQVLSRNIGEK